MISLGQDFLPAPVYLQTVRVCFYFYKQIGAKEIVRSDFRPNRHDLKIMPKHTICLQQIGAKDQKGT